MEGTLPDGVDENQPVIRVHSALPNGSTPTHYVPYTLGPDNRPELPFTSLEGTLFLNALGGELIAMQFVHRIEGLPEMKGE